MLPIILASGSPYRHQLLKQLGINFDSCSPNIDETPHLHEPPKQLAQRLAQEKAVALSFRYQNHLIIGSDQVGVVNNTYLNKPGNHKKAKEQLWSCRGKEVLFFTGLCLLNSHTHQQQCSVEIFSVKFRNLTEQQIERYLIKEAPYDCAGSFKVEGLGISLFASMKGDDPNTLVGLPLIKLVSMLNKEGYSIP